MIFDVTIVTVLGGHEPHPYKMANLINKCVCPNCSIDGCAPISLPPLGLPYSLRHNSIEIRPGTSPVTQWLRIHLPMQGTRVCYLVWEDPTCCGATKPVHHHYWAYVLEPTSHTY